MTLTGQTINGYTLLDIIGRGGFSEVYSARNIATGEEVAIKQVDTGKIEDGTYLERFKVEAEVVARLNHPHIVPVYDHWTDDSGMYMVMKWMKNGNLRRRIEDGGIRDLSFVSQIVSQIGSALQATHTAGLIHRDIKPDNVMFDDQNNAYLADFGLAKDTNRAVPLTQMGWKLGSQAYSAPEQISNDGEITPQSDIFAFGVLIFETLTGQHPFIDDSADDIRWMIKAIREPMPLAHFIYPDIPSEVDDVLQHATRKKPADRYPTVTAMIQAFEHATQGKSSPAPQTKNPTSSEAGSQLEPQPEKQSKGLFGRLFKR